MKKLVTALLAVAMLLSLGAVIFAADSQPSYTLVTHWDFEGDTPYADKATSGSTSDTLTPGSNNITVSDGIVTIPDLAGGLSASGDQGTDLYSFKNKTILIKAKTVRENGGMVTALFSKQELIAYMENHGEMKGGIKYHTSSAGKNVNGDVQVTNLGYRMYALTVAYDEVSGATTFDAYISNSEIPNSADDFVKIIESTTDVDVNPDQAGKVYIGERWDRLDKTEGVDTYVDEVKIFDGVLTAEQLAAESPKTKAKGSYTLVSHWDFEGDTPYADKATSGNAETLNATGNVTVTNGVAYIPDGENYLSASGAQGTDLYSFKNKTVLIKADMQRNPPNMVACLFSKTNLFGYMCENAKTGTLRYNTDANEGKNVKGEVVVCNNGYRMYAITIAYDETAKTTTFDLYMSKVEVPTSAADFEKIITQTVANDVTPEKDGDFLLGKRWDHLTQMRYIENYIDDVKVFDGVLTPEQMVAESPTSVIGDSTGDNTGADTDGEATDTQPSTPVTPVLPDGITTDKNDEGTDNDAQATQPEATGAADTTSEDDGGCGSFAAIGAVGMVAVAAAFVGFRKKKE